MRLVSICSRISAFSIIVLTAAVPASVAQMATQGGQQATPVNSGVDSLQTELHSLTDIQRQGGGIDSKELADYKKFYNENAEPARKIELGKAFLQKYPKSQLAEAVDAGLVNAYIARQDWPDVYTTADNALALKPDDIDVLTTVGWVIPHVSQPSDPNAGALLDKAETYEKHALDVMNTIPKPARVSDAQFAVMKEQKALQVHSALGLVYFRRSDYDASAKELQLATQGNPNADQSDLYVLGIDQQNLKHYNDAVDAYTRCVQISGSLADQCKQGADEVKKLSASK
jgi:tetratricopeptide (TPR) repeat protein